MNIYKHEFKMAFQSVLTWSAALMLLLFVFMSIYTSFALDAELMSEMMDKFPKELLMAFGMETLDLSSVLGFYSFIFIFCQICLAIQAANYGFSLVSVEERELTADFLLAKPVGRTQILTSKLLAALTGLAITNAVVWVSTFGFIEMFRDGRPYETETLILLLLSIIIFQLFFLAVGLMISLLVKRVRNVTPFSMALAFGMYVINAFGGMLGDDTLEKLSPFKHFDPSNIIQNGAYDTALVLLSAAVISVSIVASYALYNRRNIASAV